ncbi:CAP domain-containing protein [Streptomyces sp. NPDC085946]|uniref:CAP domain-containing protein n=1 Tax=Streptomyces sp. NPDC085946 TaxID=3365744 RepID=UPI0037D08219
MGSRRAARPSRSRSHARPGGGPRRRTTALGLGAAALAAGVGVALTGLPGDDGDASDRVAARSAAEAPAPGGTSAPVSPSVSASVTASPSADASPSPRKKPGKPARSASATPTAEPVTKAPTETVKASAEAGGGRSAGGDSAARSGSGGTSTPGNTSGSDDSGNGPEAQVLALVNQERAEAGCSPVTANDRLTRAADDYSDVMAASGVMSHTGPDGSTMAGRVEAAGYRWATLGENIARGQADAASVMESWMNSPGHRANILNCAFQELGVGVHFGDNGPWWTQNFGTSR